MGPDRGILYEMLNKSCMPSQKYMYETDLVRHKLVGPIKAGTRQRGSSVIEELLDARPVTNTSRS